MKKVAILGVISIVLVIFAYFALFSTPAQEMKQESGGDMKQQSANKEFSGETSVPKQGVGSLESLRLIGTDLECTIEYNDVGEQPPVTGTYYVSQGAMRGDFFTDAPDLSGQILTSVIIDNVQEVYVWTDVNGQTYGIKMDFSELNDGEVSNQQPVPLLADVQYVCKEWENVDRTVFVPPAHILFQDMNELMQAGMEYGTIYDAEGMMPTDMPMGEY